MYTCTVNCGMPVHVDTGTIHFDYNSTWVNSVLHFRCKEGLVPTELFTATCLENGRWSPDPANHTCTAPSGTFEKFDISVDRKICLSTPSIIYSHH